ncbi:hypothetical protein Atep_04630 [Allochromatium tepidum]|uniref:PAS domain-containing protein n=1 Tax=Allochromatium tepidum TaxID=553982 RepID=A0ABM7QJ47_9GAMM|nr:hypothetical protein Atep_04630 [Allochromatium tepidum]
MAFPRPWPGRSAGTDSEDGTIREANQSAAALLDEPRSTLIGRRLGLWISEDTRPAFNTLLTDVRSDGRRLRCDLDLVIEHRPACRVPAEAALAKPKLAGGIRLALTDISERKALEEQRSLLDGCSCSMALRAHISPSCKRASSLMLSALQGGSHTSCTLT